VKSVTVRVHGRVQGVWFRASTRAEAERLGVRGWVRNLSDGTVEAHLQGETRSVDEMVAWCRVGPSGASVSGVELVDAPADDTLSGFQIR
jgi:acylphosphatase